MHSAAGNTLHRPPVARLAVSCILLATTVAHSAPPGEARGITAADQTLRWTALPDADRYHVYRGDRPSLPDLATTTIDTCLLGSFEVAETGPILDLLLPPGDLSWYIVSGENVDGEGTVGGGRSHESWGGCCGETAFAEDFDAADGAPWHPRWNRQFEVDAADIQAGAARFRPVLSGYSLARIISHADLVDLEVTFRLMFEDVRSQGLGFYVRSNGGYLDQTTPPGQGYAVFIEGFSGTDGIGLWREEAGAEIRLDTLFDDTLLADDEWFRVRFRVTQIDPATSLLQARIWPDAATEPSAWTIEITDTTAALQNTPGAIFVDSWSSHTTGGPVPAYTHVDDIRVRRLCSPPASAGGLEVLEESFLFTEGPVWHGGELLFSDIQADTIYAWADPGPATGFRSPSGNSNGLTTDVNGDLLACEHSNRRVSRSSGTGPPTTVVDTYSGMRFNSPNDLEVRWDGAVYFTDPAYGLVVPSDREIPFNGLFHLATDDVLTAVWEGATSSGPNGVILSPDQLLLYQSDSATGDVVTYDVQPDGTLTNRQPFLSGLATPDGMCIDLAGNLYVATLPGLAVFAPDGTFWGTLATPRPAANCTFGDADRRGLYVTAREGLYRFPMPQPGIP